MVDDFGGTVRIDSPVTGVTEIQYNLAGQPTTRTDARGVTATTTYDAGGQSPDDGV